MYDCNGTVSVRACNTQNVTSGYQSSVVHNIYPCILYSYYTNYESSIQSLTRVSEDIRFDFDSIHAVNIKYHNLLNDTRLAPFCISLKETYRCNYCCSMYFCGMLPWISIVKPRSVKISGWLGAFAIKIDCRDPHFRSYKYQGSEPCC